MSSTATGSEQVLNVASIARLRALLRHGFTCAALALPLVAHAQAQGDFKPTARTPEVTVDRNSAAIASALPFDEPFNLTGTAAATLLRLTVTYDEEPWFKRDQCGTANEPTTVRTSSWIRKPKEATTFLIPMQALGPNKNYTFCFKSVDALSAGDSADFVGKAAGGLRAAMRLFLADPGLKGIDTAQLHRLHAELRNSLPKRDSLVIPAGSILRPLPPQASIVERAKFDSQLVVAFVEFSNEDGDRRQFATRFDRSWSSRRAPILATAVKSDTVACVQWSMDAVVPLPAHDLKCTRPLGWLLRRLELNPALDSIAKSAALVKDLPAADITRLVSAASLALSLRSMDGNFAQAESENVARGTAAITDVRVPIDGAPQLLLPSSSAELARWALNLDTTVARLKDLRDLTTYVAGKPNGTVRGRRVRTDAAALEYLRALIDSVYTAALFQRGDLGQVTRAITAFEGSAQSIASRIAARDLASIGVFSTTSAIYETRARWYVGQDLGVILAWRGDSTRLAAPYLGVNVYLRPVNKRAPKPVFCLFDLRCTSLSVGVPTEKWEQEDHFTGILAGRSLVVGVGTRIGDFARVSYSFPLIYRYQFGATSKDRRRRLDTLSAVSLTLDADLREIISNITGAIFPK